MSSELTESQFEEIMAHLECEAIKYGVDLKHEDGKYSINTKDEKTMKVFSLLLAKYETSNNIQILEKLIDGDIVDGYFIVTDYEVVNDELLKEKQSYENTIMELRNYEKGYNANIR